MFVARGPVPVPDIAALTDAEGCFAIPVPAAGTYELACAAEGYEPSSATVEATGKESLPSCDWPRRLGRSGCPLAEEQPADPIPARPAEQLVGRLQPAHDGGFDAPCVDPAVRPVASQE